MILPWPKSKFDFITRAIKLCHTVRTAEHGRRNRYQQPGTEYFVKLDDLTGGPLGL